jgi:hypothetical protein
VAVGSCLSSTTCCTTGAARTASDHDRDFDTSTTAPNDVLSKPTVHRTKSISKSSDVTSISTTSTTTTVPLSVAERVLQVARGEVGNTGPYAEGGCWCAQFASYVADQAQVEGWQSSDSPAHQRQSCGPLRTDTNRSRGPWTPARTCSVWSQPAPPLAQSDQDRERSRVRGKVSPATSGFSARPPHTLLSRNNLALSHHSARSLGRGCIVIATTRARAPREGRIVSHDMSRPLRRHPSAGQHDDSC